MRHLLVDRARRRTAQKRGGDDVKVPLDDFLIADQPEADDVLWMDQALYQNGDERMLFTRVYVKGSSDWQLFSSTQSRNPKLMAEQSEPRRPRQLGKLTVSS